MSKVLEITEVLPKLSDPELRDVERALHALYRQRGSGIIYDDAYGVWTEEDQAQAAAGIFQMLDGEEQKASCLNDR